MFDERNLLWFVSAAGVPATVPAGSWRHPPVITALVLDLEQLPVWIFGEAIACGSWNWISFGTFLFYQLCWRDNVACLPMGKELDLIMRKPNQWRHPRVLCGNYQTLMLWLMFMKNMMWCWRNLEILNGDLSESPPWSLVMLGSSICNAEHCLIYTFCV